MRPRVGAAIAAAAALTAAGCGTGGYVASGDKGNGKTLFVQRCGSCHVLADAGTTGKIGPNLDDAFGFARKQGFEESTFRQVVEKQIYYPIQPMPANLATGKDAQDIATYVASVAGNPSAAGVPPAAAPGGSSGAGASGEAQQPPGGAASNPDAAGKQVFVSSCGGCHTLKDAGTTGNVGPDLDKLHPDAAVVKRQVRDGGGGMPAFGDQLTEQQIAAVAAYVADATKSG